MSRPDEMPDAADLDAAADVTWLQKRLALSMLAAEAKVAISALSPLLAVLPEPVRTVVGVLTRIADEILD